MCECWCEQETVYIIPLNMAESSSLSSIPSKYIAIVWLSKPTRCSRLSDYEFCSNWKHNWNCFVFCYWMRTHYICTPYSYRCVHHKHPTNNSQFQRATNFILPCESVDTICLPKLKPTNKLKHCNAFYSFNVRQWKCVLFAGRWHTW